MKITILTSHLLSIARVLNETSIEVGDVFNLDNHDSPLSSFEHQQQVEDKTSTQLMCLPLAGKFKVLCRDFAVIYY